MVGTLYRKPLRRRRFCRNRGYHQKRRRLVHCRSNECDERNQVTPRRSHEILVEDSNVEYGQTLFKIRQAKLPDDPKILLPIEVRLLCESSEPAGARNPDDGRLLGGARAIFTPN